jgi:hypothetical protein
MDSSVMGWTADFALKSGPCTGAGLNLKYFILGITLIGVRVFGFFDAGGLPGRTE